MQAPTSNLNSQLSLLGRTQSELYRRGIHSLIDDESTGLLIQLPSKRWAATGKIESHREMFTMQDGSQRELEIGSLYERLHGGFNEFINNEDAPEHVFNDLTVLSGGVKTEQHLAASIAYAAKGARTSEDFGGRLTQVVGGLISAVPLRNANPFQRLETLLTVPAVRNSGLSSGKFSLNLRATAEDQDSPSFLGIGQTGDFVPMTYGSELLEQAKHRNILPLGMEYNNGALGIPTYASKPNPFSGSESSLNKLAKLWDRMERQHYAEDPIAGRTFYGLTPGDTTTDYSLLTMRFANPDVESERVIGMGGFVMSNSMLSRRAWSNPSTIGADFNAENPLSSFEPHTGVEWNETEHVTLGKTAGGPLSTGWGSGYYGARTVGNQRLRVGWGIEAVEQVIGLSGITSVMSREQIVIALSNPLGVGGVLQQSSWSVLQRELKSRFPGMDVYSSSHRGVGVEATAQGAMPLWGMKYPDIKALGRWGKLSAEMDKSGLDMIGSIDDIKLTSFRLRIAQGAIGAYSTKDDPNSVFHSLSPQVQAASIQAGDYYANSFGHSPNLSMNERLSKTFDILAPHIQRGQVFPLALPSSEMTTEEWQGERGLTLPELKSIAMRSPELAGNLIGYGVANNPQASIFNTLINMGGVPLTHALRANPQRPLASIGKQLEAMGISRTSPLAIEGPEGVMTLPSVSAMEGKQGPITREYIDAITGIQTSINGPTNGRQYFGSYTLALGVNARIRDEYEESEQYRRQIGKIQTPAGSFEKYGYFDLDSGYAPDDIVIGDRQAELYRKQLGLNKDEFASGAQLGLFTISSMRYPGNTTEANIYTLRWQRGMNGPNLVHPLDVLGNYGDADGDSRSFNFLGRIVNKAWESMGGTSELKRNTMSVEQRALTAAMSTPGGEQRIQQFVDLWKSRNDGHAPTVTSIFTGGTYRDATGEHLQEGVNVGIAGLGNQNLLAEAYKTNWEKKDPIAELQKTTMTSVGGSQIAHGLNVRSKVKLEHSIYNLAMGLQLAVTEHAGALDSIPLTGYIAEQMQGTATRAPITNVRSTAAIMSARNYHQKGMDAGLDPINDASMNVLFKTFNYGIGASRNGRGPMNVKQEAYSAALTSFDELARQNVMTADAVAAMYSRNGSDVAHIVELVNSVRAGTYTGSGSASGGLFRIYSGQHWNAGEGARELGGLFATPIHKMLEAAIGVNTAVRIDKQRKNLIHPFSQLSDIQIKEFEENQYPAIQRDNKYLGDVAEMKRRGRGFQGFIEDMSTSRLGGAILDATANIAGGVHSSMNAIKDAMSFVEVESRKIDPRGVVKSLLRRMEEGSVNSSMYGGGGGDDDSLIATHSLNASTIPALLKLGAIPSPSIAIHPMGKMGDNFVYGDSTFIMKQSAVDPSHDKRNRAFVGDAQTPGFPNVNHDGTKVKERWDKEWVDYSLDNILKIMTRRDPRYGNSPDARNRTVESVKELHSIEEMYASVNEITPHKENWYRSDGSVGGQRDAQVHRYYESKPQRAVEWSEIASAVLPQSKVSAGELLHKETGIPVSYYDDSQEYFNNRASVTASEARRTGAQLSVFESIKLGFSRLIREWSGKAESGSVDSSYYTGGLDVGGAFQSIRQALSQSWERVKPAFQSIFNELEGGSVTLGGGVSSGKRGGRPVGPKVQAGGVGSAPPQQPPPPAAGPAPAPSQLPSSDFISASKAHNLIPGSPFYNNTINEEAIRDRIAPFGATLEVDSDAMTKGRASETALADLVEKDNAKFLAGGTGKASGDQREFMQHRLPDRSAIDAMVVKDPANALYKPKFQSSAGSTVHYSTVLDDYLGWDPVKKQLVATDQKTGNRSDKQQHRLQQSIYANARTQMARDGNGDALRSYLRLAGFTDNAIIEDIVSEIKARGNDAQRSQLYYNTPGLENQGEIVPLTIMSEQEVAHQLDLAAHGRAQGIASRANSDLVPGNPADGWQTHANKPGTIYSTTSHGTTFTIRLLNPNSPGNPLSAIRSALMPRQNNQSNNPNQGGSFGQGQSSGQPQSNNATGAGSGPNSGNNGGSGSGTNSNTPAQAPYTPYPRRFRGDQYEVSGATFQAALGQMFTTDANGNISGPGTVSYQDLLEGKVKGIDLNMAGYAERAVLRKLDRGLRSGLNSGDRRDLQSSLQSMAEVQDATRPGAIAGTMVQLAREAEKPRGLFGEKAGGTTATAGIVAGTSEAAIVQAFTKSVKDATEAIDQFAGTGRTSKKGLAKTLAAIDTAYDDLKETRGMAGKIKDAKERIGGNLDTGDEKLNELTLRRRQAIQRSGLSPQDISEAESMASGQGGGGGGGRQGGLASFASRLSSGMFAFQMMRDIRYTIGTVEKAADAWQDTQVGVQQSLSRNAVNSNQSGDVTGITGYKERIAFQTGLSRFGPTANAYMTGLLGGPGSLLGDAAGGPLGVAAAIGLPAIGTGAVATAAFKSPAIGAIVAGLTAIGGAVSYNAGVEKDYPGAARYLSQLNPSARASGNIGANIGKDAEGFDALMAIAKKSGAIASYTSEQIKPNFGISFNGENRGQAVNQPIFKALRDLGFNARTSTNIAYGTPSLSVSYDSTFEASTNQVPEWSKPISRIGAIFDLAGQALRADKTTDFVGAFVGANQKLDDAKANTVLKETPDALRKRGVPEAAINAIIGGDAAAPFLRPGANPWDIPDSTPYKNSILASSFSNVDTNNGQEAAIYGLKAEDAAGVIGALGSSPLNPVQRQVAQTALLRAAGQAGISVSSMEQLAQGAYLAKGTGNSVFGGLNLLNPALAAKNYEQMTANQNVFGGMSTRMGMQQLGYSQSYIDKAQSGYDGKDPLTSDQIRMGAIYQSAAAGDLSANTLIGMRDGVGPAANAPLTDIMTGYRLFQRSMWGSEGYKSYTAATVQNWLSRGIARTTLNSPGWNAVGATNRRAISSAAAGDTFNNIGGIAGVELLGAQWSYEGQMASIGVQAAQINLSHQYATEVTFPQQFAQASMSRAKAFGTSVNDTTLKYFKANNISIPQYGATRTPEQIAAFKAAGVSDEHMGSGTFGWAQMELDIGVAQAALGNRQQMGQLGWNLFDVNKEQSRNAVRADWQRVDFGLQRQGMIANRQMQASTFQYQQTDMTLQHEYYQQDWQFNRQKAGLQYGWQQQDMALQIRRSTGFERAQLVREQGRSTQMFNLDKQQAEKEKGREEDAYKRQTDYFKKQVEHWQQMTKLEDTNFANSKKRFEQETQWKNDDFNTSRARTFQQMAWAGESYKLTQASQKIRQEQLDAEISSSKTIFDMQDLANTKAFEHEQKSYELSLAALGVQADQAQKQKALNEAITAMREGEIKQTQIIAVNTVTMYNSIIAGMETLMRKMPGADPNASLPRIPYPSFVQSKDYPGVGSGENVKPPPDHGSGTSSVNINGSSGGAGGNPNNDTKQPVQINVSLGGKDVANVMVDLMTGATKQNTRRRYP